MYTKLHDIFADKTGGEVFTCFSAWHFFYIFLVIATVSLTVQVGMYLAMSRQADREGYPEIAEAFKRYAWEEAEHAA